MESSGCSWHLLAPDTSHFTLDSMWPQDLSSFLLSSATCVCPWCCVKIGLGARAEATQLPTDLSHSPGMWPVFWQLLGEPKVTGPGNLIPSQMAFPWPRRLCGEPGQRDLAPGLSEATARGCLSLGATCPVAALEFPLTGQLGPFPEIFIPPFLLTLS